EELRSKQARQVLAWMERRSGPPQVLVGDFNSRPSAPTIQLVSQSLRSAYHAVHGSEPPRTLPTPLSDGSGQGVVIDYLFVSNRIEVHDASITFDRIDDNQPKLAASDHYGLAAEISICP
ncbi:MAG: endonuclease/exonuclease/phosphatase family protein, partial [Actinobacteria bacterium]|nr:endonuclease/exonuclease/phosphatase family protein [Actinomycetota bacterium]